MKHRNLLAVGLIAAVALFAGACSGDPGGPATPANTPPVANIDTGGVTTGLAPLTIAFDATGSVDTDGTIVNYYWDFGDSHTQNGDVVSHTFAPGTWTVQLKVTDDKGAIGTTATTIVATNNAPTADFSISPATGTAPLNATFDASTLSGDIDGTIVSYAWDFQELGTESGATVVKTIPAGTIDVTLTVTDNNGATATKTRSVTATGAPATAPTGFTKTGSGCCPTYGDFSWNPVPGADSYDIFLDPTFGCTWFGHTYQQSFPGQVSTAHFVDGGATGMCLGTQYDAKIRAMANGTAGPWSATIHFTL